MVHCYEIYLTLSENKVVTSETYTLTNEGTIKNVL